MARAPDSVADADEDADEPTDPVGDFFQRWEGKSGLYFVSPYFDPAAPDEPCLVKVGMSRHRQGRRDDPLPKHRVPYGGLGRRMDSYLLCYPYGFYVYAVLQCHRDHVYSMERFFHQYFTGKGFQAEARHSHREEWFELTRTQIFATIKAYHEAHEKQIQDFAVYPAPGLPAFVDSNGRLAAHPKKALGSEEKAHLESFMSPDRVPKTAQRKRTKPEEGAGPRVDE